MQSKVSFRPLALDGEEVAMTMMSRLVVKRGRKASKEFEVLVNP